MVVLFYVSNLGEQEEEEERQKGGGGGGGRRQEAGSRIQEEGNECSACNIETTGGKPPPRALQGPDGDTCCHAGDTQFRFQSCFVMPPIRKHGKKH